MTPKHRIKKEKTIGWLLGSFAGRVVEKGRKLVLPTHLGIGLEIGSKPTKNKEKQKQFGRRAALLAKNQSIYPFIALYHLYTKKLKAAVSSAVFGQMVGTAGFEPATSWSRTRRTTKLC